MCVFLCLLVLVTFYMWNVYSDCESDSQFNICSLLCISVMSLHVFCVSCVSVNIVLSVCFLCKFVFLCVFWCVLCVLAVVGFVLAWNKTDEWMNECIIPQEIIFSLYFYESTFTYHLSLQIHFLPQLWLLINLIFIILCVYTVQDAWLRWRLKLIVIISLSIHMMTRQDHICVQCVTNGLYRKEVWTFTSEFTAKRSYLYVQCAANGLHCVEVWMFIN